MPKPLSLPNKLSIREQKFLIEYVSNGFDRTKAAREAGFKPENAKTQAYKILTRVHVKKFVDDQKKIMESKLNRDFQQEFINVLDKYDEIIEKFLNDKEEYKPSPECARIGIEALKEKSKLLGLYAPEKKETKNTNISADLSYMYELAEKYKREY